MPNFLILRFHDIRLSDLKTNPCIWHSYRITYKHKSESLSLPSSSWFPYVSLFSVGHLKNWRNLVESGHGPWKSWLVFGVNSITMWPFRKHFTLLLRTLKPWDTQNKYSITSQLICAWRDRIVFLDFYKTHFITTFPLFWHCMSDHLI